MSDVFSLKSLKKGFASAMGVPEIKQKVLAATSNDQWGPTGTQMREISDATHQYAEFGLIMETIWERLNDHGKNWRHVYKSLLLLDYLLKNGADQCVREAKVKLIEIRTLQEFQHIDEKDKDVGVSVRERAKAIMDLLNDERRLTEERSKARENRGKYATAISSDDRRGGYGGGGRSYSSKNPSGPPSYADDYDSQRRYPTSNPSTRAPTTQSTRPSRQAQPPAGRPDLDFSDDDYADDFDYDEPSPHPRTTQAAPAPAPVAPLIDIFASPPALVQTQPSAAGFAASTGFTQPTNGFTQPATGYVQSATGYSTASPGFPAASPAFGSFTAAPGFPTQPVAAAAPAAATFPGFSTTPSTGSVAAFPASGFSTPAAPAASPFTTTQSFAAAPQTQFPQQPPTSTPAFFQPAPTSTDSDWSDFQAAEKKPEAPKVPEKVLDKNDPWARNDLFSFGGKDDKPAPASAIKKEPMGPAKTLTPGLSMGMTPAPNTNPFGMSTPAPMAPGAYMMAPTGGYMMAQAPAGYMMTPQGYASMPMAGHAMPTTVQPGSMYGFPSG